MGKRVTERMFCAYSDEKDSCQVISIIFQVISIQKCLTYAYKIYIVLIPFQGDSGGPAMDSETNTQIGIVSWALGCAQMGFPGVYTRIAHPDIYRFITDTISTRVVRKG